MSTHDDHLVSAGQEMVSHRITPDQMPDPRRPAHCECGEPAFCLLSEDGKHLLARWCPACGILHHSQWIYDTPEPTPTDLF